MATTAQATDSIHNSDTRCASHPGYPRVTFRVREHRPASTTPDGTCTNHYFILKGRA